MDLLELDEVLDPLLLGDLDDILLQLALERWVLFFWQKHNPIEYLKSLMRHHRRLANQDVRVLPVFWLLVLGWDFAIIWGLDLLAAREIVRYLEVLFGQVVDRGKLFAHLFSRGYHPLDIHLFGHLDIVGAFPDRIVPTVHSPKRGLIIGQFALQTVDMLNPLLRDVIILLLYLIQRKYRVRHRLINLVLHCSLVVTHFLYPLKVDFLKVRASHQ